MSARVEYEFADAPVLAPAVAQLATTAAALAIESPTAAAVSIVIVTRNRRDELRQTLAGLAPGCDESWEVIVVANACTDDTAAIVEHDFPWVRLVERDDNTGMAATNFGIEVATAPLVMVLDDDALPAPGAIERALRRFAEDPELHALACAVEEGGCVVNANWAPRTLSFVGCGAFFRRSTLAAIGGYSWDVPWASNERELGCRLILAGHHVAFDPQCVVVHRRSAVNRSWRETAAFHARDSAYRVMRYYPWHLVPMALAFAAGYNVLRTKRQEGLRWRDLVVLARGLATGVRKGSRRRSPIPLERRRRAARVWREEMAIQTPAWRLVALLAPRDFWW
jgi:GT2 family glycosyltransferase